ncbi:MAG: single-stranded-DNA-specific exonuclease RecJ [Clostridiales bacterium]|nr:single-stranded-DNA-specific exonuclease RecJ [Clostridiales bacterium]
MNYNWILPEETIEKDIFKELLKRRGLTDDEEIEEFLSDRPQLTYDPFLMKNIEQGADRILNAIEKGHKICIYGDYDADGVCAISLLLEILGKLTTNITYYIPSRFDEGYGLNKEAIAAIKEDGVDLIVTVDCGSVSAEEVEYAKQIGLDIVVTDHHNLNDNIVSCILVNPKQKDCPYPQKDLSGCGVAFKLAQALERKTAPAISKADLNKVLDLVAIATIGDIVPLLGENRTMVKYGLRVIKSGRRVGLRMLIEETGLELEDINSDRIAYIIVPHLNAAGRILSADTGVKLLTQKDEHCLKKLTSMLLSHNQERKRIQQETFESTVDIVEKYHKDEMFLVLNIPEAHEGIAGIVAGKIKDKYHRPTILLTSVDEDRLKGTGRSIEGIDLYQMLSECKELFEKFGGHAGACGFTIKKVNFSALRDHLLVSAQRLYQKDPSLFSSKLLIDIVTKAKCLDHDLADKIEKLEPYGHRNPKPVFCIRGISPEMPMYMGDRQQHVRFNVNNLTFVIFRRGEEFREYYKTRESIDLVGYFEKNYYNGYKRLQFIVIDFK